MYRVTAVVFYYLWYHFIKIWTSLFCWPNGRWVHPTTNHFKGWHDTDWAISRSQCKTNQFREIGEVFWG